MKIERYQVYKDSGFEWLGEIPEHWEIKRLKNISKLIIDGTHFTPDYTDFGVRFLSVNDITRKPFDINQSKFISYDAHKNLIKRCHPKKGDILLSKNGTIGIPFLIDFDDVVSIYVSLCLIKLLPKINAKYSYYSFLASFMFEQYNLHSKMTSVTNLHLDKLRNFFQLSPPLPEQKTIANYLDTKTARCDRKIDLLTQKATLYTNLKQSLINETVTRGLDKSVPRKDSGIEWCDNIPVSWKEKRVKDIFKLITDLAPDGNKFELLSLYASIGVRPRKDMEQRGNKSVTTNGYWIVKKGDIVVNKLLAWMRAIGLSEYDGVTSPAYDILRKSNLEVDARFYTYLFRTEKAQSIFKKYSRGIMDVRLRLYFDKFGAITVPVPPLPEQKAIANYLDTKTAQIDQIIQTINTQIEKLKEFRKTLINDVVTGKIKV